MDTKTIKRLDWLKQREKELFEIYDSTKNKIRSKLSDDDIYPISKLVEKLEVLNTEIEYIQNEIKFHESE